MTISKILSSVKRDFDFNTSPSCLFHHSQWEQCRDEDHSSLCYLVYRLLFMIILVASVTFSTLCQSYLFQIYLTNWAFTLQTAYAIISSFNVLWRMRGSLMQKCACKRGADSKIKPFELKETNNDISWDNVTASNSMMANQDIKNDDSSCVYTGNEDDHHQQQQQQKQKLNSASTSAAVLTTDSSVTKKPDTSVIISRNNNNHKGSNLSNGHPPSMLDKTVWILMNVSHVLPHVVTFGFWVFVYKFDGDQKPCEKFRSHYLIHGITAVLAFVDALVVAIPVRISHFVFSTFVLIVYTLFSYVYEVAGGPYRNGKEYIYSILNWRHEAGKAIILVSIGIILSPLLHLTTCYGIHRIRLWLVSLEMKRRNRNKE